MGNKEEAALDIEVIPTNKNGQYIITDKIMTVVFMDRDSFFENIDEQAKQIGSPEDRGELKKHRKMLAESGCKYYVACDIEPLVDLAGSLLQVQHTLFRQFVIDHIDSDLNVGESPPYFQCSNCFIVQVNKIKPETKKMLEVAGYEFEEEE